MPLPQPLLAQDFGTVVSILFLVLAFIGWITNIVAAGRQQQPAPKDNPGGGNRPPRERRIQQEIDEFLAEQRRRRPRPPNVREEEAPQPRPRPVPQQKPKPERPVRRPQPSVSLSGRQAPEQAQPAAAPVPVPAASEPPRRAFVTRGTAEAAGNIELGKSGTTGAPLTERPLFDDHQGRRREGPASSTMLHLLRSRQGAQQAVLMHEILAPPKSRRSGQS